MRAMVKAATASTLRFVLQPAGSKVTLLRRLARPTVTPPQKAKPLMRLSLVVLTPGKSQGKVVPVSRSEFVIGRDPQCHLRPASARISQRHCALLIRGDKAFVRDFGSTNGTFVNGRQIRGEMEVLHEDRLKVGPLEFTLRIEASA